MTETENYVERNKSFTDRLPEIIGGIRSHFLARAKSRYGISSQEAEDMIQQSYLDLQRRVSEPEFKEVGNGIRGLVLTILDRKCKDYLESRKNVRFLNIEDHIFFLGSTLDEVADREILRIINSHVEDLPEIYREAINHQIQGTYAGSTNGTHRSQVKRARKMLKESLTKVGALNVDIEVD